MKITLLILCLVVVYGSCQLNGDETNVEVQKSLQTKEIQNYKNNKDYANVPYTLLARNKRASNDVILSSITTLIKTILSMFGVNVNLIDTIVKSVPLIGSLIGGDMSSVVDSKSPLTLMMTFISPLLEVVKSSLSSIVDFIQQQSNTLMTKVIKLGVEFTMTTVLPSTIKMLNKLNSTGLLPTYMSNFINAINLIYNVLKILGFSK